VSVLFVLGFATVFAVMGLLLHSALVHLGVSFQSAMARIGGTIMIFFGLYIMGLMKLPFLERPHLFLIQKKFSSQKITAFVFGAAFAAGWTPCVGVALGGIFGLAILEPTKTFFLLIAYALGLGVPFLIIGFFTEFFSGGVQKYFTKNFVWIQYVNILFGGVLLLLGSLAFTQNLAVCRAVLWKFPF
jgi:cytochrome c-type biogenesis protein